ncbi:MAG: LuxR C-terminal-related transcriptional regulator [Bacteroidales bacterium]|nr:LuxR C-terminal-related transcriptional regulator [Bacteroidales bacterium]
MIEQTKTTEQLTKEISMLRRENKELSAQLAFHRKVFREVNQAIGEVNKVTSSSQDTDETMTKVVKENQLLKSQMKIFRLTGREKEVLKLIVNGLTSKEIADDLGISKLTVDTHRKHIQQKLGVSKQVDLLKLAMQSGMA